MMSEEDRMGELLAPKNVFFFAFLGNTIDLTRQPRYSIQNKKFDEIRVDHLRKLALFVNINDRCIKLLLDLVLEIRKKEK